MQSREEVRKKLNKLVEETAGTIGWGNNEDNSASFKEELVKKIEGMKRDGAITGVFPGDDFETTSCDRCGDWNDCDCSGYNEAIDDIIKLIKG